MVTKNEIAPGGYSKLFYLNLLETEEDKDKFRILYEEYAPLMKAVARKKLHNEHLAEDAVHDAFVNIIKSFCEIDDVTSHKTRRFLVIVTEHAAIDILRENGRVTQVELDKVGPTLSITPDMLDGVAAEELARIIASLPEAYRTVLELRAYHHLSDRQIARVLDISYGAVRKRQERARMLLAAKLQKQEEEASL